MSNKLDSIIDNPNPDLHQISLGYDMLAKMMDNVYDFAIQSTNKKHILTLLFRFQHSFNLIHSTLSLKANDYWQSKFYNLAERAGLKDDYS
ncbi:MAG: hypothetical protein MI673_03050 [Thiotrichales bacterium]|nr:hypothetical protein [Thiotrichales bacterium]